jgi:hypothetical protein
MVVAPIKLPGHAANIALGMTLAEAEQIDCPCVDSAGAGGGSPQAGDCLFGTAPAIDVVYWPCSRVIYYITLWAGYLGTLDATSRDGQHAYVIPIESAITKDGAPFTLDWDLAGFKQNPAFDAEINELYDALTATYTPSAPSDPSCQTSGNCMVGAFGDVAYMSFPKLGLTLWIASLSAGQPECSIFDRIDLVPPCGP